MHSLAVSLISSSIFRLGSLAFEPLVEPRVCQTIPTSLHLK
jgi:hypothetical protein